MKEAKDEDDDVRRAIKIVKYLFNHLFVFMAADEHPQELEVLSDVEWLQFELEILWKKIV